MTRPIRAKSKRTTRQAVSAVIFLLALAAVPTALLGESTDQRMVDGLLARRLFELAERYCLNQLGASGNSERRVAEVTVDLSRVYAEQALHAPPDQRDAYWAKAVETINDFRRNAAANSFVALADRQAALVPLARGELARHEAEVVAEAAALLQEARQYLRDGISALQQQDAALTKELISRAQKPNEAPPGLTDDELRILQNDVRSQLAKALMNQGLCYPDDSPDRTNSLQRAVKQFEPLAETTEPIDWPSRLGLLACVRSLKDDQRWQSLFRQYMAEAPTTVEPLMRLEQARFPLERGQPAEALSILDNRPKLPTVAAQWDFTRLQSLFALWKLEQDAERSGEWREKAVQLVDLIEQRHGPYWMRRAEGMMGRHVAAAPDTGDLAVLVRAAASYYRAGKLDDALVAYDRARSQAAKDGQAARALELGNAAAAIQRQRGLLEDARDRFRDAAVEFAAAGGAAQSHLLAVYAEADRLRSQKASSVGDYVQLLKEHLEKWPQSKTSDQAAWWLARLKMSQGDWQAAISSLRRIRTTFPEYGDAVQALSTAYRRRLDQLGTQHADYESVARQAIEFLAQVNNQAATQADGQLRRQALLESARLQAGYLKRSYGDVEQRLRAALNREEQAPDTWRASARLVLCWAIAAQRDRAAEAIEQLSQASAASPQELLEVVEGLAGLIQAHAPVASDPLVVVQQEAVAMLQEKRQQLNDAERFRLARAQAEAYAAAGRRSEAVAVYEQLAKDHPNDARIQMGYAQVLLSGTDAASWQAALQRWREIEKRSRRGTLNWFEAKYSQALAHERLGNRQQAARIVTLTQVLHPDLGGPNSKVRFLELLRRCAGAND